MQTDCCHCFVPIKSIKWAKQVLFQTCPRVSVIITRMTAVTSKAGDVSKVSTCVCHYHLHDSCDEQSRCCFKGVHVCLSLSPAWQLWRAKQVLFQRCPCVSVIITCMTAVTSKAGVVSKVFTCVRHYHLHDSCDEQSRCCFKGVHVCPPLSPAWQLWRAKQVFFQGVHLCLSA